MKIILSRKGIDSSHGPVPSLILPSGQMCWLPMPSPYSGTSYVDIDCHGENLGDVIESLSNGKFSRHSYVHLDPDLNSKSLSRRKGWKPLFGQCGAAQSHLENQGVGVGDIFLFYGWFRQGKKTSKGYKYVKGASDMHVIFGWLQIAEIWPISQKSLIPNWALYHPHLNRPSPFPNDVLYVAAEQVEIKGRRLNVKGGGMFGFFHPKLVLTAPDQPKRSLWRLPSWFYPHNGKTPLSYHHNRQRWLLQDGHVLLHSVGRGQEFVLDIEEYPEAVEWLEEILGLHDLRS